MLNRIASVLAGSAALAGDSARSPAVGSSSAVAPGEIVSASFRSATLGEQLHYNVYLPAGYAASAERYPVLYLLHGRGDDRSAWTRMQGALDELIASGEIQPTIAIMPDAPWSSRASYYVDSAYIGADPGRKVETAFTKDLIAHVDSTYRTVADRTGRGVAGYLWVGTAPCGTPSPTPICSAPSIVRSPVVYVRIRRQTRAPESSAPSGSGRASSSTRSTGS